VVDILCCDFLIARLLQEKADLGFSQVSSHVYIIRNLNLGGKAYHRYFRGGIVYYQGGHLGLVFKPEEHLPVVVLVKEIQQPLVMVGFDNLGGVDLKVLCCICPNHPEQS